MKVLGIGSALCFVGALHIPQPWERMVQDPNLGGVFMRCMSSEINVLFNIVALRVLFDGKDYTITR